MPAPGAAGATFLAVARSPCAHARETTLSRAQPVKSDRVSTDEPLPTTRGVAPQSKLTRTGGPGAGTPSIPGALVAHNPPEPGRRSIDCQIAKIATHPPWQPDHSRA